MGLWGECTSDEGLICSQNQYCFENTCNFCADSMKNCDMNLLTGCETNIKTDQNNCGDCKNTCDSNKTCFNGTCVSQNQEIDLCLNVNCGPNSICNKDNGNCTCLTQYYNCNGSNQDGCEKYGSCNQTPPVITPSGECEFDFDCNPTEQCINSKCVQATLRCSTNQDCNSNSVCTNNNCAVLNCTEGFLLKDHVCTCTGTICNNKCIKETGVCCEGIWNKGIDSCKLEIDGIIDEIYSINDSDSVEMINQAQDSINEGQVLKAKAEIQIAILKSRLSTLQNASEYLTEYNSALLALENKEYDSAYTLAKTAVEKLPTNNEGINFSVIIAIFLIIATIATFLFIKSKKKIELENQ